MRLIRTRFKRGYDLHFRAIFAGVLLACAIAAVAVLNGGCGQTTTSDQGRSQQRSDVAPDAAPVLKVSGTTLTWIPIPGVTSYTLATVRDPKTIHDTTYQTVTGTSFTPPAVPGEKVSYGLSANGNGVRWSREVSITWPATGRPKAATQKLSVSVNNTTGWNVDSLFREIGVSWERLDLARGGDFTQLQTAIRHGMHVLPAYTSGTNGNLDGLTPSAVTSDIASLAPRLNALGITTLEFGNEVYNSISVKQYAALYHAAHVAAAGRIKLIAVATTDYYDQRSGGSGNWFVDMKNALPGGAGEVDGWTIHPYGSLTSICRDGYGWPMMGPIHTESVNAGFSSTLPWYITEVGQEISGSGLECQTPVSEAGQATAITTYLNDTVTAYPWVVFLNFYASRDDSSGAFGLLNSDNSARLAFVALDQWMATNGAHVSG
jgi:hypothetical protein